MAPDIHKLSCFPLLESSITIPRVAKMDQSCIIVNLDRRERYAWHNFLGYFPTESAYIADALRPLPALPDLRRPARGPTRWEVPDRMT
jgi:hypothetical protein